MFTQSSPYQRDQKALPRAEVSHRWAKSDPWRSQIYVDLTQTEGHEGSLHEPPNALFGFYSKREIKVSKVIIVRTIMCDTI